MQTIALSDDAWTRKQWFTTNQIPSYSITAADRRVIKNRIRHACCVNPEFRSQWNFQFPVTIDPRRVQYRLVVSLLMFGLSEALRTPCPHSRPLATKRRFSFRRRFSDPSYSTAAEVTLQLPSGGGVSHPPDAVGGILFALSASLLFADVNTCRSRPEGRPAAGSFSSSLGRVFREDFFRESESATDEKEIHNPQRQRIGNGGDIA